MATTNVSIDMNRKCVECGKGGAVDSGLCPGCTNKAMGHQPMKSAAGRAVRERWRKSLPGGKPMSGDTNTEQTLKRFAERIAALTDQVKDIQVEIKSEMDAAKASGFSVKALNKVVKEMGMDDEKRQTQLAFEFEVDAYRRIVGLPTEVAEERQEAA